MERDRPNQHEPDDEAKTVEGESQIAQLSPRDDEQHDKSCEGNANHRKNEERLKLAASFIPTAAVGQGTAYLGEQALQVELLVECEEGESHCEAEPDERSLCWCWRVRPMIVDNAEQGGNCLAERPRRASLFCLECTKAQPSGDEVQDDREPTHERRVTDGGPPIERSHGLLPSLLARAVAVWVCRAAKWLGREHTWRARDSSGACAVSGGSNSVTRCFYHDFARLMSFPNTGGGTAGSCVAMCQSRLPW